MYLPDSEVFGSVLNCVWTREKDATVKRPIQGPGEPDKYKKEAHTETFATRPNGSLARRSG